MTDSDLWPYEKKWPQKRRVRMNHISWSWRSLLLYQTLHGFCCSLCWWEYLSRYFAKPMEPNIRCGCNSYLYSGTSLMSIFTLKFSADLHDTGICQILILQVILAFCKQFQWSLAKSNSNRWLTWDDHIINSEIMGCKKLFSLHFEFFVQHR